MSGLYGMLQEQELNFSLEKISPPDKQDTKKDEQAITIRGDLSNMSLGDIFQTLDMAKMEGTLRIRSMFESRDLYFKDGVVRCHSPLRMEARRVGRRLVDAGLITTDHLRAALMEQRQQGGLLGQILVKRGAITTEALDRVLSAQVEEDLYALFTWRKGTFDFYKEESTDKAVKDRPESAHGFEVNRVLLEVARRSDEWTNILEVIGDLDEIFTPVLEAAHEELKDWDLTVLSHVDGRRTVREIADQLLASLFDTARTFRTLVLSGVVETTSVSALLQLASQMAGAGDSRHAAIVLNLLRERGEITDGAQIKQISDLYCGLGDMRVGSRVLSDYATLGKKPEDVIELLREAFRLDSGNLDALTKLKEILGDDPANAEECFAVDASLVDYLIEQSRAAEALPIVNAMTAARPADAAGISRKARVLYKLGRREDAVATLVTLAEVMRLEGRLDRLQPIYDQILKVDPTRKDIVRSLHSIHSERYRHIRRRIYVAAGVAAVALVVFFFVKRHLYTTKVEALLSQSGELLEKGVFDEAERTALSAVAAAGSGHLSDAADAAVQRVEARRKAEKLAIEEQREGKLRGEIDRAGNLLESGDWSAALGEYQRLYDAEAKQRNRIKTVLDARLRVVAEALDEELRDTTVKEPPPKDHQSLAQAEAELRALERLYPTEKRQRLQSMIAALQGSILPGSPKQLSDRLLAVGRSLLQAHERVEKRLTVLKRRLEDERLKEDLNPTFVAARKAEEEHRFADALRSYQTLATEYRDNNELRAHFREMVEKYSTIEERLLALREATSRGDFGGARKEVRALIKAFPDIPFASLVELPLRITTIPPGATVKIAGKSAGVSPLVTRFVPGDHDGKTLLEIERERFLPERVTLVGDERGDISLLLTRQPEWTVELPGPVDQDMAVTAAGRLYVPDRSGRLHRIDPASGKILWTFESQDPSGLLFTPCEQGNRVFVASLDRNVRAVSAEDGTLAWKVDLDSTVRGGPTAIPGGVAVATEGGAILLLDPASGTTYQRVDLAAVFKLPLVFSSQGLIAASEDGQVRCFGSNLGTERWSARLSGAPRSLPVVDQGMIFLGCEDGSLRALGLGNGKSRWSTGVQENVRFAPAVSKSVVWVVTERRELRMLDLATGVEKKRIEMQSLPSSSLAVDGTRFLVGMRSGEVLALSFDSAAPLFRMAATKTVSAKPAVLPDGTVVIASEDRTLQGYLPIATTARSREK